MGAELARRVRYGKGALGYSSAGHAHAVRGTETYPELSAQLAGVGAGLLGDVLDDLDGRISDAKAGSYPRLPHRT
jgi:hypothetical protein